MATPNANSHAMKHALSQQGKTPSQSQGAAATPPVSTPFSAAHAAFSPHGPRSSPQQVKKSPATTATLAANSQPNAAINFDSPSTVAAFNALQIGGGLDLGLQGLGNLGKNEDEFPKKLDEVIEKLDKVKGLVSEAGLERLAKKHGFEGFWEGAFGVASGKKTLFIGGSALELSILFSEPDVVESATLLYPESSDIVKKYAEGASKILTDNLRLAPQQMTLTKDMDTFARNFEYIANLEKLGGGSGLNLHEAIAGIYESLARLHAWEMETVRTDPTLEGSSKQPEAYVMCSKSGIPAMNRRDTVGLTIDYWMDKHLKLPSPSPTPRDEKYEKDNENIRTIRIGCAPLTALNVGPVRISDKWIGEPVEKAPVPGELTIGPVVDWLEPESTFIMNDQAKAGDQAAYPGPRLPQIGFQATFEPPIPIPLSIWELIEGQGCGLPPLPPTPALSSYDALIFPLPSTPGYDPMEARQINCLKTIVMPSNNKVVLPFGKETITKATHQNVLLVYKPIYGRVLSDVTFSHPQQIISMLPYIRQYTLLRKLLETSFKEDKKETKAPASQPRVTTNSNGKKVIRKSNYDDFSDFMEGTKPDGEPQPPRIDVTLMVHPMPRLQLVFPFKDRTADIVLEIRLNGVIHVVSENVLGPDNSTTPTGKARTPESLARMLEVCENLNTFCEYIRTKW